MSDIVIKVEELSKQYRLGQVGTGALTHDINRWWHQIRGKQDPYLKIGDTNDRTTKGDSEYVWALQDINFEVKQGEVLGIIGRNGAGKSTLLKILSRTTAPTTGNIKIKGRIASLLEVGTGFHPELSGRENIYLNGAILGMTKKEIAKKFDAIVDFSGVERYIDTPVKRYSSGMYVRLAFAVAAHLEPDILIVDEVLAVGDMEFQKKCIFRMSELANKSNKTILFVSHDLKAISSLCSSSIILKNGRKIFEGPTENTIKKYMQEQSQSNLGIVNLDKKKIEFCGITNIEELNNLTIDKDISAILKFRSLLPSSLENVYIDIAINNEKNDVVIHSKTKYSSNSFSFEPGKDYFVNYKIFAPNLAPGIYSMTLYVYTELLDREPILWIDNIPFCSVNALNIYRTDNDKDYLTELKSIIYPKTQILLND